VKINTYTVVFGKPEKRELLEDIVVDGKQYQNIVKEMGAMAWTRFIWIRLGTSIAGLLPQSPRHFA
jgi:hypothetical protein